MEESFLITAFNKSSNDFTSCSWKADVSVDCIKGLYQALSEINYAINSQISYKNLSVRVKRGKVRVNLFNSSCLNEHSTSYFQKSCNRELSFAINTKQINSFISVIDTEITNSIAAK